MRRIKNNIFHVALLDDTVSIPGLSPRRLTRSEALNVAAWIVEVTRRDGYDFSIPRAAGGDAQVSYEFLSTLADAQAHRRARGDA